MIAFIYTQDNILRLRDQRGLKWEYDGADAPDLGFEYDYLIYDDQKIKVILERDKDGNPTGEEKITDLNNEEIDAVENYVMSSEPPADITLNLQYAHDLFDATHMNINEMCNRMRFPNIYEALTAGREGSNHPFRSDARRCLEFFDQAWQIYEQLKVQIMSAPEDQLHPFDHYIRESLRPVNTEFLSASDTEK